MNNYTQILQSSIYAFILYLLLSGIASAEQSSAYNITSPVSGVIKQVYITQGQVVKKGDLLLDFDDSLIVSNLAEAKANLRLAEIKRTEAKKEQTRAEELYDRSVLSEHDLQQANVLYAQAAAQLAQAKNQYQHAQWQMKHSKLYAGIAGQISELLSYPGQYVNNNLVAQTLLIIKK